ncbi:MAG: hypothetical protein AABY10_01745 [Nanoarchaeota archaeon]
MVKNKSFPTFWFIVLVVAVIWFLSETGYINFNVPWLPLVLIIVALGAIINNYGSKKRQD